MKGSVKGQGRSFRGQSWVSQETKYIMQTSVKGQGRSSSSCRGQSWSMVDHKIVVAYFCVSGVFYFHSKIKMSEFLTQSEL